jgi:Putative beta-barrel porin 2
MSMDQHTPARALSRLTCAILLLLVSALPNLRAQDAVRPSLAGEEAAEARHQSIENIPYNLLAGPVRFRFSITTGVEYNDNINLAQVNKESDVIIRPQFNINAIWPITQLNTLRLDLGIGYAFYINHSEANTNAILIQPGSQLSFDIFVGDFRINLHDRFSLSQDPVDEIQLSNVVDYGRFENTVGVAVLWDLNKAVLTFGYDHYTYISTTDTFSYLDRNAEILSFSAYFALTSTTGGGIESSAVFDYYNENVLNDSRTFSIGPFIETQITNYLRLRAAVGYQFVNFDSGGIIRDQSDSSDWYGNIVLSHRINAAITQTISAGHESTLGVDSNFIKLNYVRHTATWAIINRVLLATELFYEEGDDSGGILSEHIQRYGGAATVGYQLTPHITLGLRYQYTQKQSDLPLRDYKQNRVTLDGTYSF